MPEADQHVAARRLRREEDHRRRGRRWPASAGTPRSRRAPASARPARRGRARPGQGVESGAAVGGDGDLEPRVAQRCPRHVADGVVVIDEQHTGAPYRDSQPGEPLDGLRDGAQVGPILRSRQRRRAGRPEVGAVSWRRDIHTAPPHPPCPPALAAWPSCSVASRVAACSDDDTTSTALGTVDDGPDHAEDAPGVPVAAPRPARGRGRRPPDDCTARPVRTGRVERPAAAAGAGGTARGQRPVGEGLDRRRSRARGPEGRHARARRSPLHRHGRRRVWRVRIDAGGATAGVEHVATLPGAHSGSTPTRSTVLVAAVPEHGLMAVDTTTGDRGCSPTDRRRARLLPRRRLVAEDGTIYVTEASTSYMPGFPNDFLDGRPHGRLLRYEPLPAS